MQRGNLDFLTDAQANERVAGRFDDLLPKAAHTGDGITRIGDVEQLAVQTCTFHQGHGVYIVAAHRLADGANPTGKHAWPGNTSAYFHRKPSCRVEKTNSIVIFPQKNASKTVGFHHVRV